MEKNYKYLGFFMLLLIPLTIMGFYKTYFELFPEFNERTDTVTHLHAFVSSLWIVSLIVQPFLISHKRVNAHRAIGKLSYILFPLLALFFILQIAKFSGTEDVVSAVFFPLRDLMLLIIFYGLAIYHRKKSAIHMRFMISTALVFIFPTVGRICGILLGIEGIGGTEISYLLIYFILIGLIYYDTLNQAKSKPYLISSFCFMVSHVVFLILSL